MRKSIEPEITGCNSRAPRFLLELPLRYCETGVSAWYESKLLNISRSGVLFRGKQDLPIGSVLEMQIIFPVTIEGKFMPITVECWGPVVRSQSLKFPDTGHAFAVVIRDHRFTREPTVH